MKEILRHLELLYLYLFQFLKVRMSYKLDFIIGIFVSINFHVISLYSIDVMLRGYPTLNEWKKEEIFFIYALCAIPMDIFSVFFTNLYLLSSKYIIEGEFDRLLLRPINPLMQLFMERINIEKAMGLFVGFAILGYASNKIGICWNITNILIATGGIICGVAIYAGVFTTVGSIGFWLPDRMGMLPPFWNFMAFGRYPVDIFNYTVQFIVCFVIPFAFVSFFPASQILGHVEFRSMAVLTPLVALLTAVVGYTIWNAGMRRYESTGH